MQIFSDIVKKQVNFKLSLKNKSKLTKTGAFVRNKKPQVFLKECSYIDPTDKRLKILDANRLIKKPKVQNMIESMSNDGCPTTILLIKDGENLIIADGQYRSAACYWLGYKIPYSYIKKEDMNIGMLPYVSNLNTGQSNWTSNDHINLGKKLQMVDKKRVYEIAEEFVDSIKGFGKDSAIQAMFNDSTLKMKSINRIDDMRTYMIKKGITFKDIMINVRHFQNIGNRVIDIFNVQNQAYFFIKGFCEFVLAVDVKNITEDGFIKYLLNNANEFYWDTTDPAPQNQTAWKVFFITQYDEYTREIEND